MASARPPTEAFAIRTIAQSYTSFTLNNIACLPCGQTGWRDGRASARLPSLG
jgi:hypothetical protein